MKKQYSHLALFFLLCIFAACSDNKNDDIPEPDPAPDPTPTMTYHVEAMLNWALSTTTAR